MGYRQSVLHVQAEQSAWATGSRAVSPQNQSSLRTGATLKLAPWPPFSEESKEAKFTDIWRNVLERRTSRVRPGSIKKVSVKM